MDKAQLLTLNVPEMTVLRARSHPDSILRDQENASHHQAGTMVFGRDPATSVLDVDCKAHDLDNLYVTDASFFPSIGAVNPTLTIIANALRVADIVISRLG
jgi:choline dehydrogenase-like flavoprotein